MYWRVLFLIIGLMYSSISRAQIVIVGGKDGFSNIRHTASISAAVVTTVRNNSALLVDATEYDDQWLKVSIGKDAHCLDCTADQKEGYYSGYIHKSQVKNIEKLEEVHDNAIRMQYTIVPFVAMTKNITYIDGAISTVNGFSYYGADCGTPQTEITAANVLIDNQKITIPMRYIWSILHAQNNFRYFKHHDTYFALQRVGDGACTTDVVWTFTDHQLTQRLLGFSY